MTTADAIQRVLESPNVPDGNLEPANVVEVLAQLASAVRYVGGALYPRVAGRDHDETGGTVASLTEAVMGVTAGLVKIADAIHDLANAVREHGTGGE